MADTIISPSLDIREDAIKLATLEIDLLLKSLQAFWEPWKAAAMILIAAAAISAAGGLASHLWPSQPQQITIRFDQPIAVKLQP